MGYNVRIDNEQCQLRRLQYETACRLYIADRAADRANARESGRAKRFRTRTAGNCSGRQQRNSKEVYYGQ